MSKQLFGQRRSTRMIALTPLNKEEDPASISIGYYLTHDDKVKYGEALNYVQPMTDLTRPLRRAALQCTVCRAKCRYVCRRCSATAKNSFLKLEPAAYCTLRHAQRDTFHRLICRDIEIAQTGEIIKFPKNLEQLELQKKNRQAIRARLQNRIKEAAFSVKAKGDTKKYLTAAETLVYYTLHLVGNTDPEYVWAEHQLALAYLWTGQPDLATNSLQKIMSSFSLRGKPKTTQEQAFVFELSGEIDFLKYKQQSTKDPTLLNSAISLLSENIICQTNMHGTKSWKYAYALWRLGTAFSMKNPFVCDSMFKQSIEIWTTFLFDELVKLRNREKQKLMVKLGLASTMASSQKIQEVFNDKDYAMALANISGIHDYVYEEENEGTIEDQIMSTISYSMLLYLWGQPIRAVQFVADVKGLMASNPSIKLTPKLMRIVKYMCYRDHKSKLNKDMSNVLSNQVSTRLSTTNTGTNINSRLDMSS